MTSTIRYLITDLLTGKVIAEPVGLSLVEFSRRISQPSQANATFSLADISIRTFDPIAATEPRRTAVWVIRDETVIWGGIIWTRRYRSDSYGLELGLETFESYLARRRIRQTISYIQWDQHEILRNLLYWAQQAPYGNIGIVLPAPGPPSGILRDRTYYWHERATFLERMQQLSEVINGPDFVMEPGWSTSGSPQVSLLVGTPIGAANPMVVDFPGYARNYSWPDDGGSSANFWTAIGDKPQGAADSDPPAMRDAQISAEWEAGVPLLEDISTHSGVTVGATLDGYAQANVQAAANNRIQPEVTLQIPTGQPLPGVGDTIQLRISDPYRFPIDPATGAPGLVANVRILAWTMYLSGTEDETMTLMLGEV